MRFIMSILKGFGNRETAARQVYKPTYTRNLNRHAGFVNCVATLNCIYLRKEVSVAPWKKNLVILQGQPATVSPFITRALPPDLIETGMVL